MAALREFCVIIGRSPALTIRRTTQRRYGTGRTLSPICELELLIELNLEADAGDRITTPRTNMD